MSNPTPNITIPVDLTNPGQFFACCGLLELADRLWPGAEGWFTDMGQEFNIAGGGALSELSNAIMNCEMESLMPPDQLDELRRLSNPHQELEARIAECVDRKKTKQAEVKELTDRRKKLNKEAKKELQKQIEELTEQRKALEGELKRLKDLLEEQKASRNVVSKTNEKRKKSLNSKRIASGFRLGTPFNIRIDWWLVENCDGDHLKTWAGQQAIAGIATAIHQSLSAVDNTEFFDHETLIIRDGEPVAPLSLDSGRAGTALDVGYSSDKVGQPISCCVWTEFLTLIALQRFALQPDPDGFFTLHAWREPLSSSVAAAAARGQFPELVGCAGRFRLAGRDSGNRYKAFQQASLTQWRTQ